MTTPSPSEREGMYLFVSASLFAFFMKLYLDLKDTKHAWYVELLNNLFKWIVFLSMLALIAFASIYIVNFFYPVDLA